MNVSYQTGSLKEYKPVSFRKLVCSMLILNGA